MHFTLLFEMDTKMMIILYWKLEIMPKDVLFGE